MIACGSDNVFGQRRELHVGKGHLAAAYRGQDYQREHHHAHAADPGRGHAPELQPARQLLDVAEDRRPGGREARDALEPGVDERKLAAPDQVGEHPHHTGDHPRSHNDAETLLVGDLRLLLDEDEGVGPQQRREQRREQQGREGRVHTAAVGDSRREQHERGDEEHHAADISQHDIQSHLRPGVIRLCSVSKG